MPSKNRLKSFKVDSPQERGKLKYRNQYKNHLMMISLVVKYLRSKQDERAWQRFINEINNQMLDQKLVQQSDKRFLPPPPILNPYRLDHALKYVMACYYQVVSLASIGPKDKQAVSTKKNALDKSIKNIRASQGFKDFMARLWDMKLPKALNDDLHTDYAENVLAFLYDKTVVLPESILEFHTWVVQNNTTNHDQHLASEHMQFVSALYQQSCEQAWQAERKHVSSHDQFIAKKQAHLVETLATCPLTCPRQSVEQGEVETIEKEDTPEQSASEKSGHPSLSAFFLQQYAIACMKKPQNEGSHLGRKRRDSQTDQLTLSSKLPPARSSFGVEDGPISPKPSNRR